MNDKSEIDEIAARMGESIKHLRELAPHVGASRQVKEFASDQRKNLLAATQAQYISKGESVAAAEILARSNPVYLTKLTALEESYKQAETVLAEWQATLARFDACRSLLAMSRESMRLLEG